MPGTGLSLVGMGEELEQHRRQLELQVLQQTAQGGQA